MAQVKKLAIKLQTDSDNVYLATWDFDPTHKITTTVPGSAGGIRVGDYVKVKPGSTWYNGVGIDSFVFNDSWQVIEITGVRAVLGRNPSGSNNIVSPIHVNNLIGGSGGSGSTTTTTTVTALDHYEVKWTYDTGDGIWFNGSESKDVKDKYSTYSGPNNARKVRVTVKPVSKTRKVNGKDTPYWTGTPVSAEYSMEVNPPETPPTPTVTVEKYELTAEINNVSDPRTDEIQFEVYDNTTLFNTGIASVQACLASFKCSLNAGGSYRVRARAINLTGGKKTYSKWTAFTNSTNTIPTPPADITTIRGSSATSVYLEWAAVNSAKTYDIEYTTKRNYFDGSKETTTVNNIQFNHYEVTGLQTGQEYFFRVRAVNEKGESAWSDIKSVVIGKKPVAPTTWSSSTTVITGNPLVLYWVHNAEDGSTETYAEVELTINGRTETYTVKNEDTNEDTKDKTKSYTVDTKAYTEGTKIEWRIRTAGITKQYGDWSIKRIVDVYAPPTLNLTVTNQNGELINVLKEFPFFIKGLAGPKTQMPIGYHVSITANTGYETVDSIGRPIIISPGDELYSEYIDTNDPLLIKMYPYNIDLENNVNYTITVTASMNSGLIVTESVPLQVSWTDVIYTLDAEITVDDTSYVAYITPYCRDGNGEPIGDITLSVYRREFDGTFKELAVGLDSLKNTVVTDPHPSLDYARYRIVAIANDTGAVSFYDAPGYPVLGKAVIIQWDERWVNFDVTNTDIRTQPSWAGSLLKLPYNVDVSENTKTESAIVKYVGREYPVSYYGTQIEMSPSWNMEIDREDKETIYSLRRLSIFKGDVYVREPSGVGYWANVNVSFNQKHCALTIPVTLDITRVVGGI